MIYLRGMKFQTLDEAEHWIGARDELYASRILAGVSDIQLKLTEKRHPELYMDGWSQKRLQVREVLRQIHLLQSNKESSKHLEDEVMFRTSNMPIIFEDDPEFIQLAKNKKYWISPSKKINSGFDELGEGSLFRFSHEAEERKITKKLSVIKIKEAKQKPIHELFAHQFSPEKIKIMMNSGRLGSYSKVIWFG